MIGLIVIDANTTWDFEMRTGGKDLGGLGSVGGGDER